MCGSAIASTAAAAIAASTALPPARNWSSAVSVASGCEVAAIALAAMAAERRGCWKSRICLSALTLSGRPLPTLPVARKYKVAAMLDAYVYDGLRTPIGRHAGGARAGAARRSAGRRDQGGGRRAIRSSPADYEDAVVGCTNQAGEDARNVARHAVAACAGLPIETGGLTVNRLCGSGLAAMLDTARAAHLRPGRALRRRRRREHEPRALRDGKSESAYAREARMFDSTIGAALSQSARSPRASARTRWPRPPTTSRASTASAARRATASPLASQTEIRPRQGRRVLRQGADAGRACPAQEGRGATVSTRTSIRAPTRRSSGSPELKALNEGGVVTAGNASGINDGAAALIVGTKAAGEKAGAKPLARIVSAAVAGVRAARHGAGPGAGVAEGAGARRACAQGHGRDRAQRGLREPGARLPQAAWASSFDDARVNPNGGAIAIGHPLGASGARLALTAIRQLQRQRRALCARHHVHRRRPGHRLRAGAAVIPSARDQK